MVQDSDEPSAEQWERRYREQIAELDRLEAEWRESDRVLRRAIGRLAKCAAGDGEELDRAIEALHQAVRDERPADVLEGLVDQLWAHLLTESDGDSDGAVAVDSGSAPATDRPGAIGLTSARDILLDLLDRLSSTCDGDILDSLRERLQQAESERALLTVVDDLAEHLASAGANARSPGTGTVPNGTHSVLLQLLEQIKVPSEFVPSINGVRKRLESPTSETDWPGLIAEIADLINAIRSNLQQQKQDLAQFVEHIGDRIEMLGVLLEDQSTAVQDQADQGTAFDQDMGKHMQSLREDVGAAQDLEQVKDSVDERLDWMSEQLRRHREQERQRIDASRTRLERMQQRLGQLERESEQLRAAVRRKDEEALIDPLTGIPNRGGYERRALEEFERWQRYGAPLSLALLDVDHFKRINDEYGHSAGDKALRMIAQLLAKRLRRIDFLARYGGEEFVALLPGTSADSAFTVVDRLRARVSAAGFHYKGEPVTISLTAGVTAFGAGDTIEAVIERADAALYEGKQSGRDRTVLRAPPGSDA